jgi:hypothetical protein
MGKLNMLANWLMSLFILDLVQRQQPIPLMLSDQNHTMWNWCYRLCSTLNGQWSDEARKKHSQQRMKRSSKQKELQRKRKERGSRSSRGRGRARAREEANQSDSDGHRQQQRRM